MVIVVVVFAFGFTRAQQIHAWSSVQQLRYHVNPGYVNLYDLYTDGNPLTIDLAYNRQWTGYQDAPKTMMAGAQYSNVYTHMTFGGFVLNDLFGPTDYTQVQLQYSYQVHFKHDEAHFLSGGLALSAMQIRVQAEDFVTETSGDPLLATTNQSRITPNVMLGAYYQNKLSGPGDGGTYMYAGLSAKQLIGSAVTFDGIAGNAGSLDRELHSYAFAGLRHYYDRYGYDYVEPYASAQYVPGAPLHYDLGFRLSAARQHFFAGGGLSSTFQVHWQLGLGVTKSFSLMYTNGFYLGKTLAAAAGTSHEVVLSFRNLLGW